MSDEKEENNSKFSVSIEDLFETFLWNYRLIILLAVFGLLISSSVIFFLGIFETIDIARSFIMETYNNGFHYTPEFYSKLLSKIITTVDDFLLGIVLLIFGLGTYDLFISRIDPAEQQEDIRPDWLVFGSLDELKSVLGKVVLMIMIITFLKFILNVKIEAVNENPIMLLYVGGGIALTALALKWSHGKDIDHSTMKARMDARFGKSKDDLELEKLVEQNNEQNNDH